MNTKFIHMSDLHLNRKIDSKQGVIDTNACFREVLEVISKKHTDIDFILISGDLVDDGSNIGYQYLKEILSTYDKLTFYLCLGNHDNRDNFNNIILGNDSNLPSYKNINHRNSLNIISLDCETVTPWMGKIDRKQLTWLKNNLEYNKPYIITIHNPPFIGKDIDSLSFMLENSEKLYDILKDYNIIAFFCGHVHSFTSYFFGKFPCYISGSVGFELYYNEDYTAKAINRHGYSLVEVNDNNVYTKVCYL